MMKAGKRPSPEKGGFYIFFIRHDPEPLSARQSADHHRHHQGEVLGALVPANVSVVITLKAHIKQHPLRNSSGHSGLRFCAEITRNSIRTAILGAVCVCSHVRVSCFRFGGSWLPTFELSPHRARDRYLLHTGATVLTRHVDTYV